jgi:hypothetical protein
MSRVGPAAVLDAAPVLDPSSALKFVRCRCGRKIAKVAPRYAVSTTPPAAAVVVELPPCQKCKAVSYVYPTSRES